MGVKHAIWSSAIISIPLAIAWPSYTVILYILEATVVALMTAKSFRNIILASILFWIFLGLPIAWALTEQNEAINQAFQHVYLAKLIFNAILCALLASVAINLSTIKQALSQNKTPIFSTLREKTANHISVIFSFLMSLVLIIYLYFLVTNLENNTKKNMALVHSKIHSEFNHKMSTFTQVFEEKRHLFAEIWDKPGRVEKQLKDLHKRYPFFISMLIADKNGDIQSFSLLQKTNQKIELFNIKDRPYFINAINQKSVYVSSGFVGKGFGNDHIVAMSIAILDKDNNEILGILEGSLNLSSIQNLSASWGENKPFYSLITDQKDQTIKTNIEQKNRTLEVNKLLPTTYVIFNKPLFQISDLDSLYLRQESTFSWGWKLNTIIDQQEISQSLKDIIIIALLVLIVAVFIAQWLAWILSRLWTRQLFKVSQWVKNKTELPESDEIPYLADEIKILYEDIKHSRLQYIELNKELENKVHSQTAQLIESNKKLHKLSLTDPLTGLDNRRAFDNTLNHLWDEGRAFSVTLHLIDIDHFKKINDQYGHPVGDMVLSFLAKEIKKLSFKNTVSISRIGGEEFAIISTDINPNVAEIMADKVIRNLQNQDQLFDEKKIKFTVSIGASSADPQFDSIKSLYQLADKSLYQAKKAGRNCFYFSKS